VTGTSEPDLRVASLGVLGGTFNPPHEGHLRCARQALAQLGLDRVALMPVRVPPHKEAHDDPGPQHRLAMCRLAAAGDDRLAVSEAELGRAGPSYTVDTLQALEAEDPGRALTFILGADMARTLPGWREPATILRLARLAVAERDAIKRREIRLALAQLDPQERITFLDMPPIDVSSSAVRERVAAGLPIDGLVPAGVAGYIHEHDLYGVPAPASGPGALRG
jgi:nicotinate-nucleotide adenylyltransferase